ncbi:MAG: DUF58 domain-containing protein [bacterium]
MKISISRPLLPLLPTKRLLGLLGMLTILSLIISILPNLMGFWWSAITFLGVAVLWEAGFVLRNHGLMVERELPSSLALGIKKNITLTVHNTKKYPQSLSIFDHYPPEVNAEGLPIQLTIGAQQCIPVIYRVYSTERGELVFPKIQIHLQSPWQLLKRNIFLPTKSVTQSYPNFAAVAHYALMATDHRLSQMGIIKKRRRGEGQDFHQLRDYRIGDSLRQIDWKATSRMQKVISREYQDERDQELIFLLDCGHRMLAKDDELSHFDHTLNAVLLLSHVALKQGDAVGFSTFGGKNRWLMPRKGLHYLPVVLNQLYDLQPHTVSPDYYQAATDLLLRHKKRALIVLVTNLRDEDSDDLLAAVNVLKRRHLVLVASMREQALDIAAKQIPQSFTDAVSYASLQHYLTHRQQTFEQLQTQGILSLDVIPQELSVSLINHYLQIKRSGHL